jgi:hypothetical protein
MLVVKTARFAAPGDASWIRPHAAPANGLNLLICKFDPGSPDLTYKQSEHGKPEDQYEEFAHH